MAEINNTFVPISVIATTSNKIRDLIIKDGQLVFLYDVGRVVLDYKGKRTFYNQVTELESELERVSLSNPLDGYYFVIDTGVFWRHSNGWTPMTNNSESTVFIGNELPALGVEKTLYVDKTKKEISVWDNNSYLVVADKTEGIGTIDDSEIESLFV